MIAGLEPHTDFVTLGLGSDSRATLFSPTLYQMLTDVLPLWPDASLSFESTRLVGGVMLVLVMDQELNGMAVAKKMTCDPLLTRPLDFKHHEGRSEAVSSPDFSFLNPASQLGLLSCRDQSSSTAQYQ